MKPSNRFNVITREDLENKKTHASKLSLISVDGIEIEQLWVPMQVAQIISFVWNQNISKYGIDKDKKYENTEVIFKLLENALDIFDIFCSVNKDFSKLDELEKHILVYAWKKWFLWSEIWEVLDDNICPVEVAKCVSHYIHYDFQDFHDYTNKIIQEKLW